MTTASVHPDVIRDLAPLYAAGEASPATRALVEAAVAADAALAREVEALRRAVRLAAPGLPAEEVEARALGEVRRGVRRRGTLLGLAIFLTLLPLTIVVQDGRVTFLLLRDLPGLAAAVLAGAAGAWWAFVRQGRRLDGRG